jgi:hypothetical protein
MNITIDKLWEDFVWSFELSTRDWWGASVHLLVDAWISLLDLEESLLTEWSSPWVSTEPVVQLTSCIITPTEDLDGVTTSNSSGDVVIDTWFVVEEVVVDGEGTFNWTVGVDFTLDGGNTQWVDNRSGGTFVLGEWFTVDTFFSTSWSIAIASSVWEASIGDDSGLFNVCPGLVEVATIATHIGRIARDHIFWGEDNVDLATWLNGKSVWEGFWWTEGPAWTAFLLVSDWVDETIPFRISAGIKVGWDLDEWRFHVHFVVFVEEASQESLEFFFGLVGKWVGFNIMRFPSRGSFSDGSDDLVVDWVDCLSNDGDGTDNNELEHIDFWNLN